MVMIITTGIFLTHGCRIVEFVRPSHSVAIFGTIAALLAGFLLQSSALFLLNREIGRCVGVAFR
jgi:hypothetical protein